MARNVLSGKDGNTFSKTNQPDKKLIKKGIKKKLILKDISAQIITGKSKEALESLAKYLGVAVDKVDIETAMHLKQIELAIKNGDTKAYNAVMDRIKGKPLQAVDVTSKGNEIIERPKITFKKPKRNFD